MSNKYQCICHERNTYIWQLLTTKKYNFFGDLHYTGEYKMTTLTTKLPELLNNLPTIEWHSDNDPQKGEVLMCRKCETTYEDEELDGHFCLSKECVNAQDWLLNLPDEQAIEVYKKFTKENNLYEDWHNNLSDSCAAEMYNQWFEGYYTKPAVKKEFKAFLEEYFNELLEQVKI